MTNEIEKNSMEVLKKGLPQHYKTIEVIAENAIIFKELAND